MDDLEERSTSLSTEHSSSGDDSDSNIDDYIWPLKHGINLLQFETRRLEFAELNSEVEEDWKSSHSFKQDLWKNFRDEFNLSK